MGFLERFRRRRRDEPAAPVSGLFTARSGTLPPELEPEPARHPATVAADAPAVEEPPPWAEPHEPDTWADVAPATAPPAPATPAPEVDEALFQAHEPPQPAVAEPALFGHPAETGRPEPEPTAPAPARGDIETVDDAGRRVRVHDGRLDTRPGPIRMSPSEALRLAEEGPRASRRRDEPGAATSA